MSFSQNPDFICRVHRHVNHHHRRVSHHRRSLSHYLTCCLNRCCSLNHRYLTCCLNHCCSLNHRYGTCCLNRCCNLSRCCVSVPRYCVNGHCLCYSDGCSYR